jgi:hypothetical protein
MPNPSIEELHNNEKFELITKLNHKQIKEFVIEQLSEGGKLVRLFMIYQVIMIITGIFFVTRSIILAFQNVWAPIYFTLAALIFSVTLLVAIHELLHGIAIKLTGAPKVNYGAYLKKFVFYAEADQYVLNSKQFSFIALTPLAIVKLITLIGVLLLYSNPIFYFLIFVMSAHSLFCAGDIGLLSIFHRFGNQKVYTYDVKSEKTSYYYRKIEDSD